MANDIIVMIYYYYCDDILFYNEPTVRSVYPHSECAIDT